MTLVVEVEEVRSEEVEQFLKRIGLPVTTQTWRTRSSGMDRDAIKASQVGARSLPGGLD